MTRLIVIGIDGMDETQVQAMLPRLPAFQQLKKHGTRIPTISSYPTDSPTAWASLLTGKNPSQHGKFFFVKPEAGESSLSPEELEEQVDLKGSMVWDKLSEAGTECAVLFPLSVYPSWPIRGAFFARTMARDEKARPVLCTPPVSCPAGFDLEELQTIKTYAPDRTAALYRARALRENERAFAQAVFNQKEWGFFFTYYSTLDWTGHVFWDEHEPLLTPRGRRVFSDAIEESYVAHDRIVGEFMDKLLDEDVLVVLSDHGQGRSPRRLVNLNEWLRRQGLLQLRRGNLGSKIVRKLQKRATSLAAALLVRTRVGVAAAGKFFAKNPKLRKIYTASPLIDYPGSTAYVTDRSGIKAYSFAGIHFDRSKFRSNGEYEAGLRSLMDALSDLRDPTTGQRVVRWVRKREDLYPGPFVDRYPQIVFELEPEYGAGWDVNGQLFADVKTASLQPGGHRPDTGILYVMTRSSRGLPDLPGGPIHLHEIYDLLLVLAGKSMGGGSDGK